MRERKNNLSDQIAAAKKELEELAGERLRIPELMHAASEKGDAATIVKLREQTVSLPTRGAAARIKLERLKLQDAIDRREQLATEVYEKQQVLEASREAHKAAGEKLEVDFRAAQRAGESLNVVNREIEASEAAIKIMEARLTGNIEGREPVQRFDGRLGAAAAI